MDASRLERAARALLYEMGPGGQQEDGDLDRALDALRAALAAPAQAAPQGADVRVKRGGLGGPDAIWLHIGNQGFRIVCEPDEAFSNRVDWYEKQLRAAVAKIATPPPPASAAVLEREVIEDAMMWHYGRWDMEAAKRLDKSVEALIAHRAARPA